MVSMTVASNGTADRLRPRLADFAMLQRDDDDRGGFVHEWDVPFAAAAVTGVELLDETTGARLEVPVEVGHAASDAGLHRTAVHGLPTGGPYSVTLSLGETTHRARGVCVGDIWILAGQSNMALAWAEPESAAVPQVTMLGFDRRWQPAVETTHRGWLAADPVYERNLRSFGLPDAQVDEYFAGPPAVDPDAEGGGLATTFARTLHAMTGVPVGLLPCALGGAPLDMWTEDFARRKGWSDADGLFGHMLSLVDQAGGAVRGILWYQGESDAFLYLSDTYTERFTAWAASVRAALAAPRLPIVTVQIARAEPWEPANAASIQALREAQRVNAATVPDVVMAAAADLPQCDPTHLSLEGGRRLARRLARLATRFVPGAPEVHPMPSLRGATVSDDGLRVDVTFDGVVGALRMGNEHTPEQCFVVEDNEVVDAALRGDTVTLHLARPATPQQTLTHGGGNAPTVGIVDSEDMSMPLFGPLLLADLSPTDGDTP
jgi:hypothetical protein